MIDFSKLNLMETLEAEKISAEKAVASADKKKDAAHTIRQKNQMAQKSGTAQKSDIVYASEEYFNELNRQSQITRAHEKARVDWRQDLEEHRGEPAKASDEGNHPYVSIMPHKNSTEKQTRKKMDQESKEQEMTVGESVSFCEAFDNLVNEKLETGAEYHARMKEKNKAPINPFPVKKSANPMSRQQQRAKQMSQAPKTKDTRSDAEKMADAYASPRKGPGGAVRAD